MKREYPAGVLERVQAIEHDMLYQIDRICRAHGLTYWVDGGTCLGAIRHQGFIPWDDDIDIGMPIEDFKRFAELTKTELPEGMSFHTPETDPDMLVLWGKLCKDGTLFVEKDAWEVGVREGIFIDVFPYIRLDEADDHGYAQLKRTQRWAKLNYIYRIKTPSVLETKSWRAVGQVGWTAARALLHVVMTPERILKCFRRDCESKNPGEWWGNPAAAHPYPFHHDTLFDPVEVTFGDLTIMAPHDWDRFLTDLYSDYMTLPDPDKRHTHTPYMLDVGDGVALDLRKDA